jgi:type II secretory ATPase GspE/PulE/Tfp pilus assembly ATPase PilB-like protein
MSLEPNVAPELTALVSSAIKANTSNLDLMIHREEVEVLIRVNGTLEQHPVLTAEQKRSVLNEIHCTLLGHEAVPFNRFENAVFHLPHEQSQSVRVRLSMVPYLNGSLILMRLLPVQADPTPVSEPA